MATVTQLVTTPDSSNTPNATAGFTPTQGDLLVAVIVTSASVTSSTDVPTASANGITFTNINSGAAVHTVYNTSLNSIDIFVADQLVGASPASMTVNWPPTDAGTSSNTAVYAVRSFGGRVGADAVVRVTAANNGASGTAPAITFGSAVNTNNLTILAVGNLSAPAGVTPPTNWTEVTDTSCATPTAGVEVAYRVSGFTGTTVTWASNSATNWGAVGIEIDTSAPVTNYDGTASVALTSTITTTGTVAHSSGASRSETITTTATGAVGKAAGAALALGLAITASGTVGTGATNYDGTAAVALTDTITATGAVGTQTGTSVPLTDTITAAGHVGKATGATRSLAIALGATGRVGTFKGATRPLTFSITATGSVGQAGVHSAAVNLAFGVNTAGSVGKRTGASRALSFAITATGHVSTGATVPFEGWGIPI